MKRGQASIFLIFASIIVISIILIYVFFAGKSTETFQTLAEIENFDQAEDALESCISESIKDNLYTLGYNGGYVSELEGFSSFGSSSTLLSIEDMENNLKNYLDRYIGSCTSILEKTPFEVVGNGKPSSSVSFGSEVNVEVKSLGKIAKKDDQTQSFAIGDVSKSFQINFIEIYDIMQLLLSSDFGVPVESFDGYIIKTYVDDSYSESLITVYDNSTGFEFRITDSFRLN